jgi:hypothetical protein
MGVGMELSTSSVLPVLFSMSRCSSSGSASSGMIPRDRGEVTGRLSGTIGTRWDFFLETSVRLVQACTRVSILNRRWISVQDPNWR